MAEKMKKINTNGADGALNGWVMELKKDSHKTASYMICTWPGKFRGYHVHREQTSNYVVLHGRAKLELYEKLGACSEVMLEQGDSYSVGPNIGIGITNIGTEDLNIINFPVPYFDLMEEERSNYDLAGIQKWHVENDDNSPLHVETKYFDLLNKISRRHKLNFAIDAEGIVHMNDYNRRKATPEELILWGSLIGNEHLSLISRASNGEEIDFPATANEVLKICIHPMVYLNFEDYRTYINAGMDRNCVKPSGKVPVGYYLYPVGSDKINWHNLSRDNHKLLPI